MTEDYETLALKKGDRLEPSIHLMDVGDFFGLTTVPQQLTFWRPELETPKLAWHGSNEMSLSFGWIDSWPGNL